MVFGADAYFGVERRALTGRLERRGEPPDEAVWFAEHRAAESQRQGFFDEQDGPDGRLELRC